MPRPAFCAVVLVLLVAACGSPGRVSGASGASGDPEPRVAAGGLKTITFHGVGLSVPARWPVIDGAHARTTCSSTFEGQPDRAFLGVSRQGVPACPAPDPRTAPPAVDGVWMQPGESPPSGTRTVLPNGQTVYLSTDTRAAVLDVWFHRVQIRIGIGHRPASARVILDSIASTPAVADTAVLGRCPATRTSPPTMPTPERLSTPLTLDGGGAHLRPEPSGVQPRVTAASVWAGLSHDLGFNDGTATLRWSVVFGSYSAATPAKINHDGSETPFYHRVPTWMIRGAGLKTPYGPCGMTVLAPYNANTGRSMGVETIG